MAKKNTPTQTPPEKTPDAAPAAEKDAASAPAPVSAPTPATAPTAADTPTPGSASDGPPVPRKRGRPPGSGKKNGPVSPSEASQAATAKRGRPPKAKTSSAPDSQKLAKQMVGLHQVAAMATGIPELQITLDEGAALSDAIVNVCEEYDLSLSGKTGALIQLAGAVAMIYAPRLLHLKARIEAEKKRGVPLQAVGGGEHGDTPVS